MAKHIRVVIVSLTVAFCFIVSGLFTANEVAADQTRKCSRSAKNSNQLSAVEQASAWSHRLDAYASSRALNNQQQTVVQSARLLLEKAVAGDEQGAARKDVISDQELSDFVVAGITAFGAKEFATVFSSFSTSSAIGGGTAASTSGSTKAAPEKCYCSKSWDLCIDVERHQDRFPSEDLMRPLRCVDGDCTPTTGTIFGGCGPLWLADCNGVCELVPRDQVID